MRIFLKNLQFKFRNNYLFADHYDGGLTKKLLSKYERVTFQGIFGQGFCLEVPSSYCLDEFLDDLQIGSGMKGQNFCPLETDMRN